MDNTAKKFFKTSMVGGFNREDVFAYIESMSNQHAAEMQELKNELKASASQNITLSEKNSELLKKKDELEVRCSSLTSDCETIVGLKEKVSMLSEENDNLHNALDQRNKEIASQQKEISELKEKLRHYQTMEQELNKSKERIADLELSALQRADEVENEVHARMQEEEIKHREEMQLREQAFIEYRSHAYEEVETLVAEISSSYINVKGAVSGFKTGFKAVVSELAQEIDKVSDACNCVEKSFGDLCEKCSAMRESCGEEFKDGQLEEEQEPVPEEV